jgi:hypothetical protein
MGFAAIGEKRMNGSAKKGKLDIPTWRTPEGEPVSCLEKIKVLNENLEELRALAQEALEDAVLMGCDETQFRDVLRHLAEGLVNPYKKSGA